MTDAAGHQGTPGARPQDVVPTAHVVGPRKKWHCASGCMALVGSKGESCLACESTGMAAMVKRQGGTAYVNGKPRCLASGCEAQAWDGAFCSRHEAEVPKARPVLPDSERCQSRRRSSFRPIGEEPRCLLAYGHNVPCEFEPDHLAERYKPDGTMGPTPAAAASLRPSPRVSAALEDVLDDLERLCRREDADDQTRIELRALYREAAKVLGRVEQREGVA